MSQTLLVRSIEQGNPEINLRRAVDKCDVTEVLSLIHNKANVDAALAFGGWSGPNTLEAVISDKIRILSVLEWMPVVYLLARTGPRMATDAGQRANEDLLGMVLQRIETENQEFQLYLGACGMLPDLLPFIARELRAMIQDYLHPLDLFGAQMNTTWPSVRLGSDRLGPALCLGTRCQNQRCAHPTTA